jgi:hypothetical protein
MVIQAFQAFQAFRGPSVKRMKRMNRMKSHCSPKDKGTVLMTNHDGDERCASPKCHRRLTGGRSVVVARDGRRFCRQHGDHLPKHLRRPQRPKAKAESAS